MKYVYINSNKSFPLFRITVRDLSMKQQLQIYDNLLVWLDSNGDRTHDLPKKKTRLKGQNMNSFIQYIVLKDLHCYMLYINLGNKKWQDIFGPSDICHFCLLIISNISINSRTPSHIIIYHITRKQKALSTFIWHFLLGKVYVKFYVQVFIIICPLCMITFVL